MIKKIYTKSWSDYHKQNVQNNRLLAGLLTTGLLLTLLVVFALAITAIEEADATTALIEPSREVAFEVADPCGLNDVLCDNYKEARVTCYAPTGNKTASGKVPKYGMVSVSDRSIPFGTEIIIDGETFIAEDFTAKWVHEEKGFTVDIFREDCDLSFGANIKKVKIN